MPQLRAWHVRQKPGTLPKAGENTKALDLNPGLSVCLVGGICVSLTVSNDDRKLGSRSRRTRCRICVMVDEGNPRLLLR